MSDAIEKQHGSLIQHGKESDRVYLMKLNVSKVKETLCLIDELVQKNKYTKVLAKIPAEHKEIFIQEGFVEEACVEGFYKGKVDGSFMCKYFSEDRKMLKNEQEIRDILDVCNKKKIVSNVELPAGFSFGILGSDDIHQMTRLYKEVFDNYPFPIFDENYILKTMNDNVCYFGIKNIEGELVSVSSAEMDLENLNSEMTDYATSSAYRGKGFALFLLKKMEEYLFENGFKTAYTIARAVSCPMNATFAKNGYEFSGTLKNNSNIASGIESMNIWYKKIQD